MKYTLFFSYQSDTRYEYQFIKNILEKEVTQDLLDVGIELTVDCGMRGTSGNPNLSDTMLKKGEECDIFLADLTYVASFKNYKGEDKYVPNPNVMLELGHAWNYHGINHVIFIQNTDYGDAENLPVDLKGLRFPIAYNILKTKKTRKEVKQDLTNDLFKAINAVVQSIDNENKNKYLPFEKFEYCQLKRTPKQYEFIVTEYYNDIVVNLNDQLSSNNFVILSGKSGCGKSRIIKEFISRKFNIEKQNNFFYCNFSLTESSKLYDKINKIIYELHRESYFIIDNCNDDAVKHLKEILLGTNHKLIIILEHSDLNISFKINPDEYINQIIYAKYPYNSYEYTQSHITDVREILAIFNNEPYTPDKLRLNDECKDCEFLLDNLSLFSEVGFSENFYKEFTLFCSLFKLDEKDSFTKIKKLIRYEFIRYQGGFIFIESDPVAGVYAKDMWKHNIGQDSFNSLSDNNNFYMSFVKRQIQIASDCDEAARFLKNIVQESLVKVNFLDTFLGENIAYKLARIFPEETLLSLETLINANETYQFERINSILWAIDVIIEKKGFFDRAIQLLLQLHCKNNYCSVDFKELVARKFKQIIPVYNEDVSVESFKRIYDEGYLDIVKNVYSSIFKVGYNMLTIEQTQYLKDMYLFLISIRINNKEWANKIIIDNILSSQDFKISRQVNGEVRKIIKESDNRELVSIANTLSYNMKWLSKEKTKSIKALIKSMCDKNIKMKIYCEVVLNKYDYHDDAKVLESDMSEIADKIIQIGNWDNYIDILLTGDRTWEYTSYWFGYAISKKYDKCDQLMLRCLEYYKDIPVKNQCYAFFVGLSQMYVTGNDLSLYKQKRDELLETPAYFGLAMSLSNVSENTIDDLKSIKNAIIANSLSLVSLNDLYNINLSEKEYCSFASTLINISKDGSDSAIKLLDRAKQRCTNINISNCIIHILDRYTYWDVSDFSYDSIYSKLLNLLQYTIETFPSENVAKKIIDYIISGSENVCFDNNNNVINLFNVLIEKYQQLFLDKLLPIVNDDSLKVYSKKRHLADLFKYGHTASMALYIEWCNNNGNLAAEFVSQFITVFTKDGLQWTEEVKKLMCDFCDDEYVLDNISTRLYNGQVSIDKYQRLKDAYDLLTSDSDTNIRLWANNQSKFMERNIQEERDHNEKLQIWNK